MRYAIFSALYPPHMGGVERYTQNLAGRLAARGDEVTVVTSALSPGAPAQETDEAGAEVVLLPSILAMDGRLPLLRPGRDLDGLMAAVAARKPKRVVVNTRFYPLSLAGIAFGGKAALPTLVIDHGQGFLTLESPLADRAIEAYERAVTSWQGRWHPAYAGISAASARWLSTFGIETDLVVPNAIDADAFRAEASGRDFRRELGLAEDVPLAVFAGRLLASKGAMVVAEAARFLPEVAFLVAGSGAAEEGMRATRAQNLRLLGPLSHEDLSALFSQADVLCLPSLREGFATTLLEAGAWGLIPVTTHVGGSDEVLADPSWGLVLDRRTPLALAMGVDEVLGWPASVRAERSAALAAHVREACTWDATLGALDAAFGSVGA